MRPSLPPLATLACAVVAACSSPPTSGSPAAAIAVPLEPSPPAPVEPPPSRDFRVEVAPDVTLEMVWVETIDAWVGRTEVTWDQFLPYCAFDDPTPGVDGVSRPSKPLETHPYDRGWGQGAHPAVGMSWNSANLYCQWLTERTGRTFRLPTEDEWRACCGAAPADVSTCAWTADDGVRGTAEVGLKEPNEHGLCDMLGNLAEYVCAEGGGEPDSVCSLGGSFLTPAADVGPDARLDFNFDWTLEDSNWPPGRWWIPGGDQLGFRVLCVETPQ